IIFFFFQAEDGIRYGHVTGVQTCALPISAASSPNLILVCGDYDSDKELEEEEEGSLFSPRGPVAIQPRAPKPPAWRKKLSDVSRSEERRVGKECRSL